MSPLLNGRGGLKRLKMSGIKHDDGKLRWDLIPFEVLDLVVKVYSEGAIEYGEYNWIELENGEKRYFAALMRHVSEYRQGKIYDKSGNMHLVHAAFNLFALIYKELYKKE